LSRRGAALCPLTPDHSFFTTVLSTVDTRSAGRGGSRIGEAIKAGVKICVGSDFGGFPPELNAHEFASLVHAGMTPMQAIQAGTRVASEALRWDDRVGTLEPGKLADIVAVRGDPLKDISELQRVIFVMIGGKAVKRP